MCGDVVLFKPGSKTPLTAIAIQNIIAPVVDEYDIDGVFNLVIGNRADVGDALLQDRRIPLISTTGSMLNLLRWTSARTIKETFVPPKNIMDT